MQEDRDEHELVSSQQPLNQDAAEDNVSISVDIDHAGMIIIAIKTAQETTSNDEEASGC